MRKSSLPGRLVEEHNRWIVDEFQRNGQPLALTSGQIPAHCSFIVQQTQAPKHVLHLAQYTTVSE